MLPSSIAVSGHSYALRWRTPKGFGIYWSKALRRGLLHPPPTDAELADFYNVQSYNAYLSGACIPSNPSLTQRLITKIAWTFDYSVYDPVSSILALKPNPSVCDIGCGSGEFLSRMAAMGCTVSGIDPNPISGVAIKRLGFNFYSGTAEHMPAMPMFDVVTMFHSLEHCRSPEIAVRNAAALLKDDGLLVIEIPNMDCMAARIYRENWCHTDPGRHLHFFTPQSLKQLITAAELQVINVEFAGFVAQFSIDRLNWRSVFILPSFFLTKRLKYEAVRIYARYSTARNSFTNEGATHSSL